MKQHVAPSLDSPLTPESLAAIIDHTFLNSHGNPSDIERHCEIARQYGFAMVAINPAEVQACVRLLEGSRVRVGAAIGFPLGQNTVETKVFETRDAIAKGADEIDMVMNVRALQAGDEDLVAREIRGMVSLCKASDVISKVILETCYLTDQQKRRACQVAVEEGADFVKTSTGFGTGGATVEDVALMYEVVGGDAGVKASGGIRTLQQVRDLIAAGATRIGTSQGVALVDRLRTNQG